MNNIKVALVGQPNVGKSSLLNALSGAKVKVGNFTGVTVEKASASLKKDNTIIELIDLPGTYSLSAYSEEEKVTRDFLLNNEYDLIVQVVESVNLERNLAFTAELMQLGRPMIVALNMIDEAKIEGVDIDEAQLTQILGCESIKVSARTGEGLRDLINIIANYKERKTTPKLIYSDIVEEGAGKIVQFLESCGEEELKVFGSSDLHKVALDLIAQKPELYKRVHDKPIFLRLQPVLNEALERIYITYDTRDLVEVFLLENRAFAKGAAMETMKTHTPSTKEAFSERVDQLLLHPVYGIFIFLFFMWSVFQLTFTLGDIPTGFIEDTFEALGAKVAEYIPNETLASLISDGAIAGVGAVLSFLPNIMILFFGIALLESTGYMARAAFLLDGFLHKFGLHGKSFVPLVSGFGCTVPAYLATRTLKNDRDRMVTLFILNFMSCGARLPVYVLLIGAFFPVTMAGNILFGIYILGALVGLVVAWLLRKFFFTGPDEPFVMEMPRYRMPTGKLLWMSVWTKAVTYMKMAGTFILAASILIWFASSFPRYEVADGVDENVAVELQMENSYLGVVGKTIEPIFAPLGLDWKASVSLAAGLAAKEVIVSTMGVLYTLGDDVDEESGSLREILQRSMTLPSAVALMMLVLFYNPCLAATVVFRQETGGSKYALYQFILTSVVAYIMALIGYGITSLFV